MSKKPKFPSWEGFFGVGRLYLITDRQLVPDIVDAVGKTLEGGVRAVQLREKDMPVRELLNLARLLRESTKKYAAKLFINDRVDVALACRADGVHLGGQSMPPEAVKKISGGENLVIGMSAHSLEQAEAAKRSGADFITFGPVFETPSKKAYGAPLGLQKLKAAADALDIPVFAIGGIKTGNLKDVLDAGAYGAALISGILGADDIKGEAYKFMRAIE